MGATRSHKMPKKPPVDEKLQASIVRFETMFGQIRAFKAKIQGMIDSIQQLGVSFFALAADVNGFYDGWKYAPTDSIQNFTTVQSNFSVEVAKATLPIVAKDALKACDDWMFRLSKSKERLNGMDELHVAFDHYKVK